MKFGATNLRGFVVGVLLGIYKPEPNEEIYEWAERTLRIPATENPDMAGMLWSSSYSAYVRELMRWMAPTSTTDAATARRDLTRVHDAFLYDTATARRPRPARPR